MGLPDGPNVYVTAQRVKRLDHGFHGPLVVWTVVLMGREDAVKRRPARVGAVGWSELPTHAPGTQSRNPKGLLRRQFNFLPCRIHGFDRERTQLTLAVGLGTRAADFTPPFQAAANCSASDPAGAEATGAAGTVCSTVHTPSTPRPTDRDLVPAHCSTRP